MRPPIEGHRRRPAMRAAAAASTLALAGTALVVAATPAAAERVENPFVGADQYVNSYWSAAVHDAADVAGGSLGEQMRAIADTPTAVWMDRTTAIAGNEDGPGLRVHLDAALDQQQGSTPLVFNLVIYNLPGRDCFALASQGLVPATPEGMEHYKTEYIDVIADMLAEPQYADLRVVATIEPDSLPNMVTNMSHQECQESAPYYREGVAYALDRLYEAGNVYSYIDAAHAGWLGWPDNAAGGATEFHNVITSSTYGYDGVAGFVSNTSNSTPLYEPFLSNTDFTPGTFVRQSDFFEWNPNFGEHDWTAELRSRLVALGAPERIGMLIDTSRNGWGGPDRPTAQSTSTTLNTFVDESRIDRRNHRGAWCNPDGQGIGERPTVAPAASPGSNLHAYVWVKPPGESDGHSQELDNDQGKGFDRMCDPTYSEQARLGGNFTGALPDAPVAGQWFQAQFEMLVANAYPPIEASGETDTEAPTAPTGVTVTGTTSTSVSLSWTASTDNVGVTGYTVLVDGEAAATTATTSATVTGLSPDTTYAVTVTARDAAGNVSTPSASVSATTDEATGGEDTTPPTVPTGLSASGVTASAVDLTWEASSDDVGVAGYLVHRDGVQVGDVSSTSFSDSGLAAGVTYAYTVSAYDAAGNVSDASAPLSVTTEAGDGPGGGECTVTWQADSWNTGFVANLTVTNGAATAIDGWTLAFEFPSGQSITSIWSAQQSQSGASVTITPAAWNSAIAPGGSVSFGFQGTHSGTNTTPSEILLDGTPCTIA